ncbi:MAG TPA: DUF4335 domain-containing protein [Stenomitos sp.]
MPVLSPTLSRIYTPPTCTLEVTAQTSALSRWTRNPAIKSLQFLLSFDGLSQPQREPIAVQGNQAQLIALTEAVSEYIQTLLASRHTDLPLAQTTATAIAPFSTPAAPAETTAPSNLVSLVPPVADIRLVPKTRLTHELVLGSLATEQSGPSVVLKVSQLYDLATALEGCAADLENLPALAAPVSTQRSPVAAWARSAAAVFLVAGLGTATWRLLLTSPVAVSPSAPTSQIAQQPTPPASTAREALPRLKTEPSRPLVLPTVALPNRTSAPPTSGSSGPVASQPKLEAPQSNVGRSQVRPPQTVQVPQPKPADQVASLPSIAKNPQPEQQAEATADTAVPMGGSISNARSAFSGAVEGASAPIAPSVSEKNSSLFDTIPQVAEVRTYVAQRWQPPQALSRSLEYRLTLNRDGTLANVEPLGTSAQQYLNQVPLPSPSSAFVSPLEEKNANIRLVLQPDGNVQTFLDGSESTRKN